MYFKLIIKFISPTLLFVWSPLLELSPLPARRETPVMAPRMVDGGLIVEETSPRPQPIQPNAISVWTSGPRRREISRSEKSQCLVMIG